MRFLRKHGEGELERTLRAARPEPRSEFLSVVVDRIGERRRGRVGGLRFALAASLSAILLVALAGVGGLSYAASSLANAVGGATSIGDGGKTASQNPSSDQYKPGKGCGDENRAHERRHECKMKVNDAKTTEGSSGLKPLVFTVSLDDSPIDTVTVAYTTANGTATAGQDYLPTSGTLTFAPGVTVQTITVNVIGDTVKEPNETFYVNLFNVSTNALIVDSQGVGTIVNDDR